MNQVVPPKFGVGAPLRRKEDEPLITGKGIYTADYQPEGCLHGYMVRSAMAHARISLGNIGEIREMDGVRLVLTGAELEGRSMPCNARPKQIDGSGITAPVQPVLCPDEVRYVGDAIAFIVADDIETARNAAEMLEIDYDPLDVVVGIEDALAPGALKVWPQFSDNVAFTFGHGDEAKADAAFAQAAKTVSIDVVNNRIVANYMELRGCVAEYDGTRDHFKVTLGTQGGHIMRNILCSILELEADAESGSRVPAIGWQAVAGWVALMLACGLVFFWPDRTIAHVDDLFFIPWAREYAASREHFNPLLSVQFPGLENYHLQTRFHLIVSG
ncbi:xanthine dehydrogenase family protein molybdopterin-binding subunit, partial [Roseibium sp.]|uniref:xanthine dehydrogenase family protein molybdopterin-binding subunit n=1 Tax=Roseibium sp. TaxID=1936156 RepID=UPI003D1379FA